MNFDFNEQQILLRQMTREFLTKEAPIAVVRELLEDPNGYSKDVWAQLADLGLLGLTFPEAHGGQALGMVELALVLEELGRAVLPSPFFATVVLAGTAIAVGGTHEQQARYLPDLANGRKIATLALMEQDLAASGAVFDTIAQRRGNRWVIDGKKTLVPYGQVADNLIIPARTTPSDDPRRGITLFVVPRTAPGVTVTPLASIDLTNRIADVTLEGVAIGETDLIGRPGDGGEILGDVLDVAAVGAAAEMLGAARKSLDMSVEYVSTRVQFGQPVGSFQAVKHKCAEMLLQVEQSHAATYYAAWALSARAEDASIAASVAKSFVGDGARKVCGDAIQVHGGMGFTWAYDLHLFFKRAKHLEPLYGDADYHRDRALSLSLARRAAARTPVAAS
jgi:alkylation response protein AidB-like acyl-CoA dehydrogenase